MMRLITTFGLGHAPVASGTFGSLPPVALALVLWFAGVSPATEHGWAFHAALVLVAVVFSAACVLGGDAAEARWGKDPKQVVADETAGQCLPLVALPACAFSSWTNVCLTLGGAFLLFRVLDIIKPWPAHGLQRLRTGWGILIDDLIAGLYAAIAMQLLTRLVMC